MSMFKQVFKRSGSLLLALVMVLGLLPAMALPVWAASVSGLSVNGLTASFTNGTWATSSENGLNGSATGSAKGTCSSASATTSTLTLTNSKGEPAQLSFDYAKPTLGSGGWVKIDNTEVKAAGSFTKKLAANETITVVILSGSAGAYTSSIEISNINLVVSKDVTTTFKTPTGSGSYTVNGTAITATTDNTQNSTLAYTLKATPASGYKLEGWFDETAEKFVSVNETWTAFFESDTTIYPVFIKSTDPVWAVGEKWYTDLNAAIDAATFSSTITLLSDGTLPAGTYTLPAAYKLLIPYDSTNTWETTVPELAKSVAPSTPSKYRTLTMAKDANLIINGSFCVGGKLNSTNTSYTGVNTGAFGYVVMNAGSTITVNGSLYCWGYISGSGEIIANSGAKVYEPFQICDLRGGTATSNLNGNNKRVFPFSQYYVQNIEAPLTVNYGATEYVVGSATVQNTTKKS